MWGIYTFVTFCLRAFTNLQAAQSDKNLQVYWLEVSKDRVQGWKSCQKFRE